MRKAHGAIDKNPRPFKTRLRPDAGFNSFLDNVCLHHGPIPDIGRFLLAAAETFHRHGIALHLAADINLMTINAAKTTRGTAGAHALGTFALIGRTADGQFAATLAAHISASANAASAAAEMSGTVVEFGRLCLAPHVRGNGLGLLLQRIGRGVALGNWNIGTAVTIGREDGHVARLTRAEIIDDINVARDELMAAFNAARATTPVEYVKRLH